MKRFCILAALGILFPTALFAQSCSWICDEGASESMPEYKNLLRLSEFLPNPDGDDAAGEFIEIENITNKAVDLTAWKILDASGRSYTFTSGKIFSHTYLAITRTDSKLSLNNTGGETVSLQSPDGVFQDEIEFEGTAPEGASYARADQGWSWTTSPTAGKTNVIMVPNEVPELEVEIPESIYANEEARFSAVESTDPDGDPLSVQWAFSDNETLQGITVTRIFKTSGEYTVEVTVSDSKGGSMTETYKVTVSAFDLSDALFLNELYPKPNTGEDEFIEITNMSDRSVELGGWQLTDGSRVFTFTQDMTIAAFGYLAIHKAASSIALNDTGDSVQLIRPDESIADTVSYTTAQKAKSYARSISGWSWEDPTPGSHNQSQETGVVLGAMTNASVPISLESIDVSKSFFQTYGIYIAIVTAVGVTSFGLYKKWRKDRANQDEYDVV